ncbi:LysR family transcriptional regulator [Stutzerimonas sp. NM35]|uniref:LysR family transcriptional regulator n=1 Tax=Stutzerimonas stutzeri TaxID=316 RepID=UPI0015E30D27|nr:LysR substrate-binding domain-containing protein [Stutzerimonas stutzeri]MBA1263662.1 LysR family transcriptional regulator [Stutzerimonas stutzeri]
MSERSPRANRASQKQQPKTSTTARTLGDLYWYAQVVEAGSFSGAAERTGIAKSSLSRRIAQLEQVLKVQLLNRSTRLFAMTTVGEQIYRHALEMISALEAALQCAVETNNTPSGLIRLAAPSALADWVLGAMAEFQRSHPRVQFALILEDRPVDLATQRLDLALNLNEVPEDSNIVARPLAELSMVIVGSPALLTSLGNPSTLDGIADNNLLTLGANTQPQAWRLQSGPREIHQPALLAENTQTLLKAARAGLGLACLPLYACSTDLAAQNLKLACPSEHLPPATLYALTPPYKGITSTARQLIESMRHALTNDLQGIEFNSRGSDQPTCWS